MTISASCDAFATPTRLPDRVILVLAGAALDDQAAALLRRLNKDDDCLIVAADGGAAHLAAIGVTPRYIIGDGDSCDAALFPRVARLSLPREKDFTDGEAALRWAMEHSCDDSRIWLFGALGGQIDHTLGNLLLPLYVTDYRGEAVARRLRVIGEGCELGYCCGEYRVQGRIGDMVSLVPLTAVSGLCLEGFKYGLDGHEALLGDSRTLRNELAEDVGLVSCDGGWLLVVHYRG